MVALLPTGLRAQGSIFTSVRLAAVGLFALSTDRWITRHRGGFVLHLFFAPDRLVIGCALIKAPRSVSFSSTG